jgi:very-short-patch-repair endonuclease
MGRKTRQASSGTRASRLWALARRQHGVVARSQLLHLGFSKDAIAERIDRGRLHRLWRGVYVVGRPEVTKHGRWMAAVLACGPRAVLSHKDAGELWGIGPEQRGAVDVSIASSTHRRRPDIVIHRRPGLSERDVTTRRGIPVTTRVCTLIDLASCLSSRRLEAAINEADKLGLADPESLRRALDKLDHRRPGVAALRTILDRRTFRLTDSELERRFLAIVRQAALPLPQTGRYVEGFKVDFLWPDLGLVVETDGLRYHRTPAQQASDRERDQAHTARGYTPLRFTHSQVRFEPERVLATLSAVASRLRDR